MEVEWHLMFPLNLAINHDLTCISLKRMGALVHWLRSRGKISHFVMFSRRLDLPEDSLPTTTTSGSLKSAVGGLALPNTFQTAL